MRNRSPGGKEIGKKSLHKLGTAGAKALSVSERPMGSEWRVEGWELRLERNLELDSKWPGEAEKSC